MRAMTLACLVLCIPVSAMAGKGAVTFKAQPKVSRTGDSVTVSFAVDRTTDVEVAILDAKGKVVRHLAAGVLGGKTPPPPPLKPGLSQSLAWDGRDDYGDQARGGPFSIRVRGGMGVRLEKIVGGDPYAFFSREIQHHNHSIWTIAGLDANDDD